MASPKAETVTRDFKRQTSLSQFHLLISRLSRSVMQWLYLLLRSTMIAYSIKSNKLTEHQFKLEFRFRLN